jgi:hypothetical protein
MSAALVGRVLRSRLGHGDPNVRLLFTVVAEETGSPRQRDPDGWVRLGIRELAGRIGCDHATVPDVIDRAEQQGLKVDWPGPNRRLGYLLPADLYPDGEQVKGRPRPPRTGPETGGTVAPVSAPESGGTMPPVSPPPGPQSGGITPPEVVAPRHHVPSLTRTGTAEDIAPGGADDDDPPPASARSFVRETGLGSDPCAVTTLGAGDGERGRQPDKAAGTNAHPKPAYTEPGTWTAERRADWIIYAVGCIRAGINPHTGQPDRLPPETREPRARAYLNTIAREDLSLVRARLQSGETPPGYQPFLPKWAEGGPPHTADPDPDADCAECPPVEASG